MNKSIMIFIAITFTLVSCSSAKEAGFGKADKDGNGTLCLEEYQAMIHKNTIRHMAHSELKGDDLKNKMIEVETSKFNKTDTNGDKKVTYEEHQIVRVAAAKRKAEKRKADGKN